MGGVLGKGSSIFVFHVNIQLFQHRLSEFPFPVELFCCPYVVISLDLLPDTSVPFTYLLMRLSELCLDVP